LKDLKSEHSIVKEIRGRGLMIGMELNVPGQQIVKRCLEKGAIINCTHDTVLRFVPPLVVEEKDIEHLIRILDEALKEAT
jgi:acetylornithine aminotransferase